VTAPLPGDDIVPRAALVMDRAFDLLAPPETVWPWFVQLGKRRAGWYLPLSVERFIPPRRRGLRSIDDRFQGLAVGDVIPDWGGSNETFTVALLDPQQSLVYRSVRGRVELSWAITLTPTATGSRAHFRLRLGDVKHIRLAGTAGGIVDLLTVAALARGVRERLR